jgi:glyoxalase-like protein
VTAWIDRQLPQGDEIFLDHAGYFVADLEAAAHQLRRLGFQVSPLNVQYNANERGDLVSTGTSNRLALLERGFIELLASTGETPLADQLRSAVARYQGLHLIALTHADMAAQRRRLVNAGFAMQRIVNLRRRVTTAEGERLMAYSVLRTEPGEMAEGRVQMLTNHTPELLWTPGSTVHENWADALTELLICVGDPDEAAMRYGRFTGRSAGRNGSRAAIVLDRGRLLLVNPSDAAAMLPGLNLPDLPYIAGIALRSADLAATRRVLMREAIKTPIATDELICVGPDHALGTYLLFHAGSVDAPWHLLARSRGESVD